MRVQCFPNFAATFSALNDIDQYQRRRQIIALKKYKKNHDNDDDDDDDDDYRDQHYVMEKRPVSFRSNNAIDMIDVD